MSFATAIQAVHREGGTKIKWLSPGEPAPAYGAFVWPDPDADRASANPTDASDANPAPNVPKPPESRP
jgi:hypothetical protein